METSVFIGSTEDPTGPNNPNSSKPSYLKIYTLFVLGVLAAAGISAGITFYCIQPVCPEITNDSETRVCRKQYLPAISDNHSSEYEIFTVPKDGSFFIHGLIWQTEEKLEDPSPNYVWLGMKPRSVWEEIVNTEFHDKHATFGCELQNLRQDTKILLRFNKGRPDKIKTVFHICALKRDK